MRAKLIKNSDKKVIKKTLYQQITTHFTRGITVSIKL